MDVAVKPTKFGEDTKKGVLGNTSEYRFTWMQPFLKHIIRRCDRYIHGCRYVDVKCICSDFSCFSFQEESISFNNILFCKYKYKTPLNLTKT